MSPVAGWYPDTAHPLVERWFDGFSWTDTTRPAGNDRAADAADDDARANANERTSVLPLVTDDTEPPLAYSQVRDAFRPLSTPVRPHSGRPDAPRPESALVPRPPMTDRRYAPPVEAPPENVRAHSDRRAPWVPIVIGAVLLLAAVAGTVLGLSGDTTPEPPTVADTVQNESGPGAP